MGARLDIVIPVYNEGRNIGRTLTAIARDVKTPARVLICHDMPEDDTLPAVRKYLEDHPGLAVEFVLNSGRGAHRAVMTGFAAATAPCVLVFPADDDYNTGMLDKMVAAADAGADIVSACRFMPGGSMVGCPWLKAVLVRGANFTLYHFAGLPSRDASNGFRLFSQRAIATIAVESDQGFCYGIELLVKSHRLGWRIADVPAQWHEREEGASRFRVVKWLPAYLRWYFYAFATTWLRRPARTVALKRPASRSN